MLLPGRRQHPETSVKDLLTLINSVKKRWVGSAACLEECGSTGWDLAFPKGHKRGANVVALAKPWPQRHQARLEPSLIAPT